MLFLTKYYLLYIKNALPLQHENELPRQPQCRRLLPPTSGLHIRVQASAIIIPQYMLMTRARVWQRHEFFYYSTTANLIYKPKNQTL